MKICPTCQTCYEDTDISCGQAGHGPLSPSRPGSRLVDGRYRLDRLLGRGGMGAVYAGAHVELERPAAIKMLLPDLVSDRRALERFKREARAAARLNHPNVAGTYDFGTLAGGESYIVMELVEGETLRDHLAAAGALPLREAVLIARQIADGIESAHRGGVIHRDLKPSNIVVSRDHHGGPFVKVLDFGVAKLKGHTTGRLDITLAGAVVGTPRYMSPEQCAGHEADARSDVYSLGVILYEMIAGRAPFDAPNAPLLALKQVKEPPPPLEEARPDVPGTLARLVTWALSKDPADRPQTAAEFSRALREAEEQSALSSPNSSRAVTPPEGARGRERRGAGVVGASPPAEAPSSGPQGIVNSLAEPPSRPLPASRAVSVPSNLDETLPAHTAGPRRRARLSPALALAAVFLVSAIGTILFLRWREQSVPFPREIEAPAVQDTAQTVEQPIAADPQPSPEASPAAAATPEKRDEGRASEADKKGVQSALTGWVAATNSRDLKRQVSYYAPRLEAFYLARNVSRDRVLAEKRSVIGQADRVTISAGEPSVEFSRDRLTAVMTFRKRYVIESGGKRRNGEVVQELRWARAKADGQEWRITSERDLQVIR